jgi:hypothetical protein
MCSKDLHLTQNVLNASEVADGLFKILLCAFVNDISKDLGARSPKVERLAINDWPLIANDGAAEKSFRLGRRR